MVLSRPGAPAGRLGVWRLSKRAAIFPSASQEKKMPLAGVGGPGRMLLA